MNKTLYLLCFLLGSLTVWAGNPDRQGESGAGQLLLNPWARSAGLHTLGTSLISGVEAMRLNPAGVVRIEKTQIMLGHAIYLEGTDIRLNALGVAQRIGKNGAFGFSLMSVDLGEILVTTTNNPDPDQDGPTFSPSLFNLGLSYAHVFENKVSVGVTLRGVSESTADVSAFAFAIDAGVQYVTGEQDNFKFGISLRNIGSRLTFTGQGLSTAAPAPDEDPYNLTYSQRSTSAELPSLLNIGASYDLRFGDLHRLTVVGNFTANSFSRDQIGGGLEYSLNDIFQLRAGYRADIGTSGLAQEPIYSGLSAGATLEVPLSKERKKSRFGLEYAYRATRVWNGTHNIGIRLNL